MKLVLVSLLCFLLSFILEDIQITEFGQFVGSAQRSETSHLCGIWETLLASIGNWFVMAAGDSAVVLYRLLLESNPCCIQMIQLCYTWFHRFLQFCFDSTAIRFFSVKNLSKSLWVLEITGIYRRVFSFIFSLQKARTHDPLIWEFNKPRTEGY